MNNQEAIKAMRAGLKMRCSNWPEHQYYTISAYGILYDEHNIIRASNATEWLRTHDYDEEWEIYEEPKKNLTPADMEPATYDDYVRQLENRNKRLSIENEKLEIECDKWWKITKEQAKELSSVHKNAIWVFISILLFLLATIYILNTTIASMYYNNKRTIINPCSIKIEMKDNYDIV